MTFIFTCEVFFFTHLFFSLDESFFIVYIIDLPNVSELVELLLFPIDTSIFDSHSNPNTLESVLNNELKNNEVWLRCNKLAVIVKKTTHLSFKPC